jgi:hypothetical protein
MDKIHLSCPFQLQAVALVAVRATQLAETAALVVGHLL